MNKYIAYGYGNDFAICDKFLDYKWDLIIDNDKEKWGKEEDTWIIGSEYLSMIDTSQYNFFVFMVDDGFVVKELVNLGVEIERIWTLKEQLEDKEFLEKYLESKKRINPNSKTTNIRIEIEKYLRKLRKEVYLRNNTNYFNSDRLNLWLEERHNPIYIYKQIKLLDVLVADVAILLDYITTDFSASLYKHPIKKNFYINGCGEICMPFFTHFRKDHQKRAETIKSLCPSVTTIEHQETGENISNEDEELIFQFNNSLKDEYSDRVVIYFEKKYNIKLTNYEKDWFNYMARYYIQLIDFLDDSIVPKHQLLVSMFPYYRYENIIYQLYKNNNKQIINYQHGRYSSTEMVKDFKNQSHLIYLYGLMESDYYLVWNIESYKDLIEVWNKPKNDVLVLGNPMRRERLGDGKSNKFLVIFTGGRDSKSHETNAKLVQIAERIASEFDYTYDVRFHPLQYCAEILTGCLYLNQIVDSDGVYDFMIGYKTTLISEYREVGYKVFEYSTSESKSREDKFSNYNQLELFVKKHLSTDDVIDRCENLESIEIIKNKYEKFFAELLN